jgi:PIN domain nuclease of toxin-antitoxin system
MRLLVDTHVFIWWDDSAAALSRDLREALTDPTNEVYVSAATVWEIAIKRRSGKINFAGEIVAAVAANGFQPLAIAPQHAEHAGGLPFHHSDPFDRLLVAQAMLEGLVLATQDRKILLYGVAVLGLDRS